MGKMRNMGKLSFWESVRVWIGEVAFDVFLWAIRMSADEYIDTIQTDHKELAYLIFDLRGENYALRERVANLEKMITRSA